MSLEILKKKSVWIGILILIILTVFGTLWISSMVRSSEDDEDKIVVLFKPDSIVYSVPDLELSSKASQQFEDLNTGINRLADVYEKEVLKSAPVKALAPVVKVVPLVKKSKPKKVYYKKPVKKKSVNRSNVRTIEQGLTEYYAKHPLKASTSTVTAIKSPVAQKSSKRLYQSQTQKQIETKTGLPPPGRIKVIMPSGMKQIWGDVSGWTKDKRVSVCRGVAYIPSRSGNDLRLGGVSNDNSELHEYEIVLVAPTGSTKRLDWSNAGYKDDQGYKYLRYSYNNGVLD